MSAIVSDSPIPFYRQLYSQLRKDLSDSKWKPGDRLPSEAELIAEYGVSRITVRQAFELLVNDGLVYRRRGSGTFVTIPPIEHGLNRIISFSNDMQRRGMHPETRVIALFLEQATSEIAQQLDVDLGTELAVLERLCLADGIPISLERSYLVHKLCPGVLDADHANIPLNEVLLERYGIRMARAHQAVQAVAAANTLANQLHITAGAPLFFIEQVTFQQGGLPVEFLQVYHRGDRYVFYNELYA